MFQALQQAVGTAVIERFVLLANHVLASEPQATQRLKPHSGRVVMLELTGWPTLLPVLPTLAFGITPAGLLEWRGPDAPISIDLRLTVDGSNPAGLFAQGLAGRRPPVEVSGDATLAADVSWLMDHLRWDIEDDLAKLIGPGPARELSRIGATLAAGLREGVKAVTTFGERLRPGGNGHRGSDGDTAPR